MHEIRIKFDKSAIGTLTIDGQEVHAASADLRMRASSEVEP